MFTTCTLLLWVVCALACMHNCLRDPIIRSSFPCTAKGRFRGFPVCIHNDKPMYTGWHLLVWKLGQVTTISTTFTISSRFQHCTQKRSKISTSSPPSFTLLFIACGHVHVIDRKSIIRTWKFAFDSFWGFAFNTCCQHQLFSACGKYQAFDGIKTIDRNSIPHNLETFYCVSVGVQVDPFWFLILFRSVGKAGNLLSLSLRMLLWLRLFSGKSELHTVTHQLEPSTQLLFLFSSLNENVEILSVQKPTLPGELTLALHSLLRGFREIVVSLSFSYSLSVFGLMVVVGNTSINYNPLQSHGTSALPKTVAWRAMCEAMIMIVVNSSSFEAR